MKKNKEKIKYASGIFENNSMHLFTMLCGYFLLVLVLYSIFQIVRIVNLNFINIVSIAIPIIIYLLRHQEKTLKIKLIIILSFLFLLLVVPFFYSKTYDLTEDGNAYHKPAIALIKNGWNPLYETVLEYQEKNDNIIPSDKEENNNLWIEHYPKATWIIAAVMYSYTNNIECGKCITLILDIMLMIIAYNCLAKIIDKKWSYGISILLALNPIVIVQLSTYYVDGIMGILFAIELFLLILWKPKEKIQKQLWICLAAIASIMVNIKFTGLLCSGVVAAVFYFYHLIVERKNKNFLEILKKVTIPFIIIYVIAVFLVGSNSYIKNTIDHKNPLYPLMGKDKVDIITTLQPKSFKNKTKFEKLIISLFSKSENASYNMEPSLKIPFIVYKDELEITKIPDSRMGGFGPLFAMVMILCIISLCLGLWRLLKTNRGNCHYFVLPILSIIISIILVGEGWWARYIPQLYLLPLLTLILILYVKDNKKNKALTIVQLVCLTTFLVLNDAFFSYGILNSLRESHSISRDMKEMKEIKDLKLRTISKTMYGYYYTLQDNNVIFEIDEELEASNAVNKYCTRIMMKSN